MNKKKSALINGRELMVIGIIIAMVAVFSILSPTFRTYPTLVSVLDSVYYVALMAIGVTFPLITGGVDLSMGTGLVCYALVGGYMIVHKGMPVVAGILIAILLGVIIGLINGVLVAVMDLPPFLATLCTCMITRGLGPALCGGFGVSWPSALSEAGTFLSFSSAFLQILLTDCVVMRYFLANCRVSRGSSSKLTSYLLYSIVFSRSLRWESRIISLIHAMSLLVVSRFSFDSMFS